ncbi:OsmC family protein [Chitinophaga pendula]|uniref:OsmC family protein n=1 Tax=Chitinophaga TaxID=79328 RepID=UPI000BAF5AB7|nr:MULTISPECIES: OsmC family protein [Chitinophaga]ASZ14166.1 peroxiredoxin [Chitinophaga sp. MD30]UCJ08199.1 OsmC family protein [Chitinophaga pendula]
MAKQHHYALTAEWTGNTGIGTTNYRAYERSYTINSDGKPEMLGSADPAFRGDPSRYNPEDMLVAALSACHMLSYLYLCTVHGIVVTEYIDKATGIMEETPDGGGRFNSVTLYPEVTITNPSLAEKANSLHHDANKLCYIANSCNFPIHHEPVCRTK